MRKGGEKRVPLTIIHGCGRAVKNAFRFTGMRKGGEKRVPLSIIQGCGRAAKNAFRVFRRPSASVYYCQRKPKNRKNGVPVGLGTRLVMGLSRADPVTPD